MLGLVHHVQAHYHGEPELGELKRELKGSAEQGGVHHVHHRIHLAGDEEIAGELLGPVTRKE